MKKLSITFILFFIFSFGFVSHLSPNQNFVCYNYAVKSKNGEKKTTALKSNIYVEDLIDFKNYPKNINFENEKIDFEIKYKDKKYVFNEKDFKLELSDYQKKCFHDINIVKKLKKERFTNEEILNYVYPETERIFQSLSKIYDVTETHDEVLVKQNKCELEYISGTPGRCIDKIKFYEDCFNQIMENKTKIKINLKILEYKKFESAESLFCEKGSFNTNFATSSEDRKNNIRVALSVFDGLVIEEGEIFSFNEITGKRNEENGYKTAKIIHNGTYILGYGGGVCQVSSTIYVACLMSGLEILEVSSHSLPVSYVEPSFDAMVNFGAIDLKVRNNSGGKIIITTSCENDRCRVKIYGLKNEYKITRQSEKISVIPAEPDFVETDVSKYDCYNLEIGEEKRLSYPKDGFVSRGYLNYFDENGNLVKREMIRENRYNATRGIVLKREK